jgi:two-component system, chemotaxis family, CheB/CheR fusion protein
MKKTLPAHRARQVAAARPPPIQTMRSSIGNELNKDNGRSAKASQTRSPKNLENILNSSGIAILSLDRALRLRFFTPAAASLFEITVANLGQPLAQTTRRFTDDDFLLDTQTVINTGVSLWREVQADNGAWYNRRLLPDRTEDNEIQGVVVTFADVSEMKAAEQEVETTRSYSNSIIDTIRQSLIVLDHEMRIVSASPSFYRSFAVVPVSAVGRNLPDLRDGCLDVQALRNFLDRIAANQDVVDDYEIEIDLPPRGRRVLQLNAREIAAVHPTKRRVLLAIDDITDRKGVEAAVETGKRQAERANLGKSRFLAAASHDLRQPLQTIALLQGILATKITDPDGSKLVTRLGESLDVMSGILNKLLDINQLEAGIVTPELENFPVNAFFDRLGPDFAQQAKDKELHFRMVASHLNVRSDPTLLEQIVRNLISNALKYTSRGKILLGCRRHGDRLRIEVWDTGPGIPAGQLKAVFEEFHQLDNPARERARGLGLGLSIVQRLADLLGHRVDVRSRPGEGSVFSIEVPCIDAETGDAPRTRRQQPPAHVHAGASILVIEDDPAIREMLQLLFDSDGYRTAVAADGWCALELIAHGGIRPDIVVADYSLPNGLNGLEAAARLRQTFGKKLPVLIVTGDISTDTLRAITGADCIQLNKPIKADELTRLVRAQILAARQKPDRTDGRLPAKPVAAALNPTVFLIDDDDNLREAMRDLIEREGRPVEAFASGEAFLDAYRPDRKGCLLVDARLPGMGGLALLQRLKAEQHGLPSIMITGHGEVAMAVDAMKAGAIDFIEKPVSREELLASVDRALELTHDSMALSAWRNEAETRIAGLTPRERQIMELVIIGRANKIIAADLRISQRTVENHRAAVMKKTRSKSLSDLVRLAIVAA